MRASILFSFTLVGCAAQSPPFAMPCRVSDHGATYDLSTFALNLGSDGYSPRIDQSAESALPPFTYTIGVCNDILPRTEYPLVPLSCMNTKGSDNKVTSGPAPAYQVASDGVTCQRLGDHASNGALTVFMDQNSRGMQDRTWAHGVELRYTNGDACPDPNNPGGFIPRNVTIVFECIPGGGINKREDMVVETTSCAYYIIVKTTQACPVECSCLPSDPTCTMPSNRPCSGHGVCGYDATNSKAKCFCNELWADGDGPCSRDVGVNYVAPKINYGPNIAGGFFGGCLLGAACVMTFFVVKAKMSGGSFMDALDFSRVFGGASSGTTPYTFTSLPSGPSSSAAAFTGASDGYAPPDASAGLGTAYAATASGGDYASSLA